MPSEREVVRHLTSKYKPEAIIVVGSRADDHARAGSDWDVYVLLPPDASARRGPLQAPEALGGDLLDVALLRLPIDESEIGSLFGPNLQQARILCDNERGDADRLCQAARALYARGRGLLPEERVQRRYEMLRNISRMKARADEPSPFFEALTYVFYIAHRYRYEILHDRWSISVHRAMAEIAQRDSEFHRQLETLIGDSSNPARIAAAEAIFAALFGAERAA